MLIPQPANSSPAIEDSPSPVGRRSTLATVQQAMIPLICLRDCEAPYRGRWVVYNNGTSNGSHHYCAIHHLKSARKATPEMLEERSLSGEDETARFVRHLILHGWSIYEITDAIAASKVI